MTEKGWMEEVTPNNTVACFLQDLTDKYSIKFQEEGHVSKKVFLVDYVMRVGFTIPVLAENENEAQDAADKLIDTGRVIPSQEVAYMLNSSWHYDEPCEISDGYRAEDIAEEYGRLYDASEVLGGSNE